MHKFWLPYFAPDDNAGIGVADPPKREESIDDDTDYLADLIDNKPPKTKEADEPEEESDEDLLVEEESDKPEEKEKEEKEDEEELIDTNSRNVDFKKIKEKYSDFAKTNEYRELRNSYHREAQYTEVFPTIEDAREAAENNETFIKLNDALVNHGNVEVLLNALSEAGKDVPKKLVGNFLDAVAKYDQNLYLDAISPVIKRVARQMYTEGQKYLKRNTESEEGIALTASARNLMQFAFEDPDLVDKDEPKQDPKISEREKQLDERENRIRVEKYQGAFSIVSNSIIKHLDKSILSGLDPDNQLSEFTRDSLIEKIRQDIFNQIDKDTVHVRRMGSLWKRAEQNGYDRGSLSSLVSAYLERARPIITQARNKYKSKALPRQRVNHNDEEQEPRKELKIPNSGKSARPASRDGRAPRVVDPKKIDYKNTSDDDIFEGRVKLRN